MIVKNALLTLFGWTHKFYVNESAAIELLFKFDCVTGFWYKGGLRFGVC